MATLSDILNTARDAIGAQQFGMSVTGQNVSNVNTDGYVKRSAVLTPRVLAGRSFGSVEASLRRNMDLFAVERHLSATGLSSAAAERDGQLSTIEAMFNDFQGTGLGGTLNDLFASFSNLAANPNDLTVRSDVLQKASAFADRSREMAGQLQQFRTDLFQTARSVTSQISGLAERVAELNEKIAQAVVLGGDAADLKDQRARVLGELSGLVDIDILNGKDDQITVHATGTTLVESGEHRDLSVSVAADNSLQIMASFEGSSMSNVTSYLQGGKLAGIVEVRDSDIVAIAEQLDVLVYDIANAVNEQHRNGYGLDAQDGRDLFTLPTSATGAAATVTLDPSMVGQPNLVAASATASGLPGDADNALAMAMLSEATVVNGNSMTATQAYASLIGDVGTRKAQAEGDVATRQAMTDQAMALRESVSGVSLDEEMIALTKFQRAFQAASQVINAVDEMLGDLISTVR